MSEEFNPSPEFADLFFLAVDHGFNSIQEGGGPLTPFTMVVRKSGERLLVRFAADSLEEGVEQAKASIRPSEEIAMYAIALDGFITLEGRKWDAILVEAGESNSKSGVMFCQRYLPAKKGLFRNAPCERVGNPALVGRPQSRLWVEAG